MSEATTETGTPPTEDAPAQVTDWKDEAERLREELVKARKWEQRAKENSTAAKRLAEFEDAQKSEIQRANEERDALRSQLAEVQSERLRLAVAAKHGITGDNLDLLAGSSDEAELEARAKKIAALITPKAPKGAVGPYVPGEGGTPEGAVGGPAAAFAEHIQSMLRR